MNKGKVRIYELSKELNLENKDILAICDRLNIAVKSHSSTITEGEADRIRATGLAGVALRVPVRGGDPGALLPEHAVGREPESRVVESAERPDARAPCRVDQDAGPLPPGRGERGPLAIRSL